MNELFSEIGGLFSGNAQFTSLALLNITVVLYFLSSCAYFAYIAARKNWIWRVGFTTACVGCIAETAALGFRWYASGWTHPPFTNMYESLVFFAWGIVLTYLIVEARYKLRMAGAFIIPLAFAAMGLASLNPDKEIAPLVPALQSIWLHIHVFTASVGYAAFLVAFGISLLFLIKDNLSFNRIFAVCSVLNVAGLIAVTKGKIIFMQFPINAVSAFSGKIQKVYIPGTDPPEFLQVSLTVAAAFGLAAIVAFVASAFLNTSSIPGTTGKADGKSPIFFLIGTTLFTGVIASYIFGGYFDAAVSIRGNPYSFALVTCLWFFSLLLVVINTIHDPFLELLPSAKRLDDMAYRSIMIAFPIMTLIIVTGAIWANQAWGRYWGWDPKETASLVTWIIYLIFLHTRITKGWSGRRTAYISIIGFASVVFTFLGVNLLLSGLHAYATG